MIDYPADPFRDLAAARHAYDRARLLSKCRPVANGCWEWALQTPGENRPHILIGKKYVIAARAAYRLLIGPIKDGMSVCHTCDNPLCVNPAHLWLGTHGDNMADKVAKGRARGGRPASILSVEAVARVKRAILDGATQASQARRHAVSATTISAIATGLRWANVPAAPAETKAAFEGEARTGTNG